MKYLFLLFVPLLHAEILEITPENTRQIAFMKCVKQYDQVVSRGPIFFPSGHQGSLEVIKKGLKKGGAVDIQVPAGLPDRFSEALADTLVSDQWMPYFLNYSPKWKFHRVCEYRQLLFRTRLKPFTIGVTSHTESFSSRAHFETYLATWLPHLDVLPSSLAHPFLSDLIDNYSKLVPSLTFTFPCLSIHIKN